MGRSLLYFLPYYLVSLMYVCLVNTDNLVLSVVAIESAQYTVVRSESDLEIRLYGESSWMSALVPGATTFEKSTKDGFHRLTHQSLKCHLHAKHSSYLILTHCWA